MCSSIFQRLLIRRCQTRQSQALVLALALQPALALALALQPALALALQPALALVLV